MYTILLVGSDRDDIYLSLFEAVVRYEYMVKFRQDIEFIVYSKKEKNRTLLNFAKTLSL